ncbi:MULTISPECIES: hypothetical protein [unclassified Streptomyces]|uniref:hypothetical protein n=1 Tax=unclassified Streptomyces TaxID=2593676 RepID=UPI0037FB21FF
MRLLDLLHPHLDGVTEIVDATGGGIPLEPYLHLPEGIGLTRSGPDDREPVGEGQLLLLSYGPDPARHGNEEAFTAALGRMRPGGRGLVVFGHTTTELPYHRLLDGLVAHRCQVLRAAGLGYVHLHGGAVFACTDSLLPLHDGAGRPVPGEGDGNATALRIAGEYVLTDFVSRAQRDRLLDLERRHEEDSRALETLRDESGADRAVAAVRERDQIAAALRQARDRVGVLEARVAMLQGSTSLRVGQVLISAARSPLRGSARLPRELYGMWRGRSKSGGPVAARPKTGASALAEAAAADGDRLHLAHRAFSAGPRDRLVVAGVLNAATAADFAHDAVVNRALPHDATLVAERTDPDVLVVQLSACTGPGPWTHTGTGLAPDLDRRLAELLSTARAAGRPTVLWRDGPASGAPGLSRFPWDAVIDGDTGVQPARLDLATTERADLREIFAARATRVRLSQLARIAGAVDPLDGRRIAVLADPRDGEEISRLIGQVLAQLHRPAEVLVPTPGTELAELTAGGVTVRASGDGPTTPWVADWTDLGEEREAAHLLDLMCAQECSGADAVGYSADGSGFVPQVNGFRPALVRKSLWRAPEGAARLFTIRQEDAR